MGKFEYPRAEKLFHNPAYSHVVVASGGRTIYTAGQVSTDERGEVVGAGDLAAQTAQVMRNLGLVLSSAGASYEDVVKITTSVKTPDADQLRRINEVIDRLVSEHGYCTICANELLTYVGTLLSR